MPPRSRTRRLAVLIIVIAAAAASTVTIAATPAVWQLGQLELRACQAGSAANGVTLGAWCADLPVPEARGAANGRQIKLHIAIIKSDSARPADDLLVYLAGGPGGAATSDYSAVAAAFAEMRSRRHVLLIDQRGTGASNALSCQQPGSDAEVFVGQSAADAFDRIDKSRLRQQLQACLARLKTHADPRFYTTGDAVEDLETVRKALGAPLLNLVGVSYGTRLAQQYAIAYPASVRSIVLDSAVPNSLVLGSEHAINMEAALRADFALCTQNLECARRFGDPYAALTKLRLRLKAAPANVTGRDPLSNATLTQRFGVADLAVGVRLFAYNPATVALLPLAIDEALQGNFQPLLGQEQLIVKGLGEQLTDGLGLTVSCAEDADLLRPRPQDADTLLGTALLDYTLGSCEIWPRGARRADFHRPFKGVMPALVLAGEHDPVTPARYGAEIVAGLPNARLLKLKGQGHGVMATGCLPKLLQEFVEQLKPRSLDASCLDTLGDTPAFLGYSGAGP